MAEAEHGNMAVDNLDTGPEAGENGAAGVQRERPGVLSNLYTGPDAVGTGAAGVQRERPGVLSNLDTGPEAVGTGAAGVQRERPGAMSNLDTDRRADGRRAGQGDSLEAVSVLLAAERPLTYREIAHRMDAPISKKTLVRLIDRMEVCGFMTSVEIIGGENYYFVWL